MLFKCVLLNKNICAFFLLSFICEAKERRKRPPKKEERKTRNCFLCPAGILFMRASPHFQRVLLLLRNTDSANLYLPRERERFGEAEQFD